MSRPSPAGGGFFLVVAIFAGFVIGMMQGDPLSWSIIGTMVGATAASILWIVDRRRTGQ